MVNLERLDNKGSQGFAWSWSLEVHREDWDTFNSSVRFSVTQIRFCHIVWYWNSCMEDVFPKLFRKE